MHKENNKNFQKENNSLFDLNKLENTNDILSHSEEIKNKEKFKFLEKDINQDWNKEINNNFINSMRNSNNLFKPIDIYSDILGGISHMLNININNVKDLQTQKNLFNDDFKNEEKAPISNENNLNSNSNSINTYNYFTNNILNTPNVNITSYITEQEIDKQQQKFEEIVERAKTLNSSDSFGRKFDVKKYLPKHDLLEDSKTLRKYKDLIKPNNLSKYACFSNSSNINKINPIGCYANENTNIINKENKNCSKKSKVKGGQSKEKKFSENKDNSISEIPFKEENMFDDDISRSELNFNVYQSPIKIIGQNEDRNTNNNIDGQKKSKNIESNNYIDNIAFIDNFEITNEQEYLKYNLSRANNENNISNSHNSNDICFGNLYYKNKEKNFVSKIMKNKNDKNFSDKYNKQIFEVWYEEIPINKEKVMQIKIENSDISRNEIEKTNLFLNNSNKSLEPLNQFSNINNNYCWTCLNYINNSEQEKIIELFLKDKIN